VNAAHHTSVDMVEYETGMMFKAFCDICLWSDSIWHHADEFDPNRESDEDGEPDPADAAYQAAFAAGASHEREANINE
jgi:hypothetical protein